MAYERFDNTPKGKIYDRQIGMYSDIDFGPTFDSVRNIGRTSLKPGNTTQQDASTELYDGYTGLPFETRNYDDDF